MRFFLIRHAETSWNNAGRIQGDLDIPLNATGIQQINDLRQKLEHVKFDAIYSSDLKRAMQTAEILQTNGFPIIQSDCRLRERDYGAWKRLTWDEVREKFPNEYRQVKNDPVKCNPPDGENLKQVAERVLDFFESVSRSNVENIAIVSHNSPLMIIIAKFKQIELVDIRKIAYLHNTEIIELELNSDESLIANSWIIRRNSNAPLAFREKIV